MTHERNTIETLEDGTKRLTDAAGAIYRAMPDSEFGLAAFYDRGERWAATGEVSVKPSLLAALSDLARESLTLATDSTTRMVLAGVISELDAERDRLAEEGGAQ